MRKTGNKWKTDWCPACGKSHSGYSGKLDSKGVEYVVCGLTHKRSTLTHWELEEKTEMNMPS